LCNRLFRPDGRLFYMCRSPNVTHRVCNLIKHPDIAVFGFARDAAGELYVLGNRTGVAAEVGLDGRFRDREAPSNLAVGIPFGEQPDNLRFPG